MRPQVSVIMPVYNMESYIRKALDSVLSQKSIVVEVVCINDGSTDDSLKILHEYINKDSRIVIKSINNSGAGLARNEGINLAKGEYLAFLDPDDWYPDDSVLFDMYKEAKKNDREIIIGKKLHCSKFFRIDKRLISLYPNKKYKWWEIDNLFMYQCAIYNKQFICENGIQFPDYRRFQDPPFFLRALILAGEFYFFDRYAYCYRREGQTFRWSKSKLMDYLLGVEMCTALLKTNSEFDCTPLVKQLKDCLYDDTFILGMLSLNDQHLRSKYADVESMICSLDEGVISSRKSLISDTIKNPKSRNSVYVALMKLKLRIKQSIKGMV